MYVGNIKIRPFMPIFGSKFHYSMVDDFYKGVLNYYHFIDKVPIKAPFNEV